MERCPGVGIVRFVETGNRFDHGPGPLRRGRAIEVSQCLAVDLSGQCGELAPPRQGPWDGRGLRGEASRSARCEVQGAGRDGFDEHSAVEPHGSLLSLVSGAAGCTPTVSVTVVAL